jgi:hypothetical protein
MCRWGPQGVLHECPPQPARLFAVCCFCHPGCVCPLPPSQPLPPNHHHHPPLIFLPRWPRWLLCAQSNKNVSVNITTVSPFVGSAPYGGGGGLFLEFASPAAQTGASASGTGSITVNGVAFGAGVRSAFQGGSAKYGNEVASLPLRLAFVCFGGAMPCSSGPMPLTTFRNASQTYVQLFDSLDQSITGYSRGDCVLMVAGPLAASTVLEGVRSVRLRTP